MYNPTVFIKPCSTMAKASVSVVIRYAFAVDQ